jgi:hypothetical protein
MSQLAMHEGLVVPATCVDENRTPPSWFLRKMQETFAKDMLITWHKKKQRWVIEQCIEHHPGALFVNGVQEHSHLCRRIYVWLVRHENNGDAYMPLSERVIERLHEMETYRKYGTGPNALAKFRAESAAFDREQEKKKRENAHEIFRYLKRHHRVVRNKLKLLMERHDWLRPNK